MPIPNIAVKGFSAFWDVPEQPIVRSNLDIKREELNAEFVAIGEIPPPIRNQYELYSASEALKALKSRRTA